MRRATSATGWPIRLEQHSDLVLPAIEMRGDEFGEGGAELIRMRGQTGRHRRSVGGEGVKMATRIAG
jgi:hypothetical protein